MTSRSPEPVGGRSRALTYIPALDGLRALSLIAILLYHSTYGWARGGYLGVTVFFTLSGFLITTLLLRERDRSGTIRLRHFWKRRAQRLAPAVLGLLALVIVYLLFVRGQQPSGIADDALASATWVANWRFIFAGSSYANLFSNPSPFQHMWSLAVEEQMYLVLPGIVLLVLGRKGKLRLGRLAVVLGAAMIGSSVACALLWSETNTTRSYFGTDTRVAEPLVGALLAIALFARGEKPFHRAVRWGLDMAAVGALAGLVLLVHGLGEYDRRLYQGGFVLTAGLAAVVLAAAVQPGGLVSRALATQPLVFLGQISYGGYLYHWPLFIWISQARTGLSGSTLLAVRLGATIGISALSFAFIESPVRRARALQAVRAGIAWVGASVVLVAGVAVAVAPVAAGAASDFAGPAAAPPPPPTAAQGSAPLTTAAAARTGAQARGASAAAQAKQAAAARPVTVKAASATGSTSVPAPTRVHATPNPNALRVALVGDSLGDDLGRGLDAWSKNRTDVVTYNLAIRGCPLAPGGTRRFPSGYTQAVDPGCAWWTDSTNQRLIDERKFAPDVILVHDSLNEMVDRKLPNWPSYQKPGQILYDNWMQGQYQQLFQTLNPSGKAKIVLLNAPCADWEQMSRWQGQNADADYNQRIVAMNNLYANLVAQTGVAESDLDSELCPGGHFTSTVEGVQDGRPDGYHLSSAAELAVATRWLGPLAMRAA